jgi:murein DD-endopeptidase MepM/ murein hydrolase activator NlpD
MEFSHWAAQNQRSLHLLFPTLLFEEVIAIDMSIQNDFFGENTMHEDVDMANQSILEFQKKHPKALLANGYLEERLFYNTSAFERVMNGRKEFRNIHLGTDFWVPSGTDIHACWDGEVVISHDNNFHKDYGPTLVLRHTFPGIKFYTLYGHLSRQSLVISEKGKKVKQGEKLGSIGHEKENGHWAPHLHFQLITDLLGETENYKGVAFPSEIEKWKHLCPNPNRIFNEFLPSAEK